MTQTPPDWYPDPGNPANVRYWDGTAWTALTRPVAAAPPAAPPAMAMDAFTPKRSRRGLWITLSLVGVLVLGLGVAAVLFVAGKFSPLSPDYSGAPVTAADEAPVGMTEIISDTETVAVEIPNAWVDAGDYMDLGVATAGLPTGGSLVGAWFTSAPTGVRIPQLVMLFEFEPGIAGAGSLSDLHGQYVSGLRVSVQNSDVGETTDVTSSIGLDGKRTDLSLDYDASTRAEMTIATLGHGRRLALFAWTSYEGPVDEAGVDAFLGSLRMDS